MTFALKAGDRCRIFKYGAWYSGTVVRVTRTRTLVRFTQKSGKTVERWVEHQDAR